MQIKYYINSARLSRNCILYSAIQLGAAVAVILYVTLEFYLAWSFLQRQLDRPTSGDRPYESFLSGNHGEAPSRPRGTLPPVPLALYPKFRQSPRSRGLYPHHLRNDRLQGSRHQRSTR